MTVRKQDRESRSPDPLVAIAAVGAASEERVTRLPDGVRPGVWRIRRITESLARETDWVFDDVLRKLGCPETDETLDGLAPEAVLASLEFLDLVKTVVEAASLGADAGQERASARHAFRTVVDIFALVGWDTTRTHEAFFGNHDGRSAIDHLRGGGLAAAFLVAAGAPGVLGIHEVIEYPAKSA